MRERLLLLVAAALCVPALPWLTEVARTTPATVLAAAAASAVLPGIAAVLMARRHSPGVTSAGLTFLWGAVPAVYFARVTNDALLAQLTGTIGEADSRWWTGAVLGPLVEETMKLASLIFAASLWSRPQRSAGAGAILGGLVGAGFAMTENTTYFLLAAIQGGPAGLLRGFWLRAVVGALNHPAFSAAGGCLIGLALAGPARRPVLVAAGVVAATSFHVLWNTLAAPWMNDLLCGAPPGASHCLSEPTPLVLFAVAPLIVAVGIGPAVAFTARMIRQSPRPASI